MADKVVGGPQPPKRLAWSDLEVWSLGFLWRDPVGSVSRAVLSLVLGIWCLFPASSFGEEALLGDAEERIIHYESPDGLSDPVARLQKRLADGTARLSFEHGRGYLPALLKALKVPVSSQALVFSKTSSQRDQTGPLTPRAIYFGDDISIGWVPGGPVIDLASVDPNRGPIFYTLEQKADTPPQFTRHTDCMRCHFGPKTLDVPGLVVGSFYTASNGMPLAKVDGFVNGHNSPLSERWGGWYVTGHSRDTHLGNLFASDPEHPERVDLSTAVSSRGVTDLRTRFDTSRYLSRHSDLVALLVLEHQVRMQNLITRANYQTRYALNQQPENIGTPAQREIAAEWRRQRIALAGEGLLEYLLCRDEAPLHGPVKGTSDFAREFQRRGPRASRGRSLQQLDLQTRLCRYPCSFLIYSSAFDALPKEMKAYLWRRLEQILTGQDQSATYATLTAGDRQDVLDILRETKPEFAAWLRK
ncbi:MAG: hypothetical protein QOJ40_794 [Verrucomicrobiota bacterium]